MTQQTYEAGLLFTQAHKRVRGRIYDVLAPYKLNPSYWSILSAAVANPDGTRLATIAKNMEVKAPLVTMLSNDLIDMGVVKRVPHHTDGRAKLLIATPKGRRLAVEVEQKIHDEIAGLLHGLSDTEIQTFQKALTTIIQNASKA